SRVRTGRNADDARTAGGCALEQIRRCVTHLGDVGTAGDTCQQHRAVDEIGIGPPARHFVARHRDIDDAAVTPTQALQDRVDNDSIESGVQSDANPAVFERAEYVFGAVDGTHVGAASVVRDHERLEARVDLPHL